MPALPLWFWPVALLAVWTVLHMKTSRSDGTLIAVHPVRRIMQFIMPTRNESIVYVDVFIDGERLAPYLDRVKADGANMTHILIAAANIALAATPKMNRFVMGRRLYQRSARHLTFSMKRARMDREAAISTVKLEMLDGETFPALVARVNGSIKSERSGNKTSQDKELDLFNLLPRPVLVGATWLLRELDYFNVLPGFFIQSDPMYTSIFIANLGSLGMPAAFHHLYEYGNCPFFIAVGSLEDTVVPRDGQAVVRKILHVRITMDERIEDGLNGKYGIERFRQVLEDPERHLGDFPMWPQDAAAAK